MGVAIERFVDGGSVSQKGLEDRVKAFVLDTNELINDPTVIESLGKDNVIVLPKMVLEELDKLKISTGPARSAAIEFWQYYDRLTQGLETRSELVGHNKINSIMTLPTGLRIVTFDYASRRSELAVNTPPDDAIIKSAELLNEALKSLYASEEGEEKKEISPEEEEREKEIASAREVMNALGNISAVEVISEDRGLRSLARGRGLRAEPLLQEQRYYEPRSEREHNLVYLLAGTDAGFTKRHPDAVVIEDPELHARFFHDLKPKRDSFYADKVSKDHTKQPSFVVLTDPAGVKRYFRLVKGVVDSENMYVDMPINIVPTRSGHRIFQKIAGGKLPHSSLFSEGMINIVSSRTDPNSTSAFFVVVEKAGRQKKIITVSPEALPKRKNNAIMGSIKRELTQRNLLAKRYPIDVDPNGFLVLLRNGGREEVILMKTDGHYEVVRDPYNRPLGATPPSQDHEGFPGITPRNREQAILLAALTNNYNLTNFPNKIFAIEGPAGCGKTLLAFAAALYRQAMSLKISSKAALGKKLNDLEDKLDDARSDAEKAHAHFYHRHEPKKTLTNKADKEFIAKLKDSLGVRWDEYYTNFRLIVERAHEVEQSSQGPSHKRKKRTSYYVKRRHAPSGKMVSCLDFEKFFEQQGLSGGRLSRVDVSDINEYVRLEQLLIDDAYERGIYRKEKKVAELSEEIERVKLQLKDAPEESQPLKVYLVKPSIHAEGEDHGFLPGDKAKKTAPWQGNYRDLFEKIVGWFGSVDKGGLLPFGTYDAYVNSGLLEFSILTELMSKSLDNSIVLVDEAQDIRRKQLKDAVLTRLGYNSSAILTGDHLQVHHQGLSRGKGTEIGLKHVVNTFLDDPDLRDDRKYFAHVNLWRIERSELAKLAVKF
ncbi:MAG: PhoH family protein [Candidatus Woesearchaeota archaeon]|nr:MAG: PhoH family protein [Candidatus Woesearchaeota archaeon]